MERLEPFQYFHGSTPVLSYQYSGTSTAVLQYFLRSTEKENRQMLLPEESILIK